MASEKSLNLRKIKENPTTIGNYTMISNKWFRDFKPGDFVYSRDGVTKYLVSKNGNFVKIRDGNLPVGKN